MDALVDRDSGRVSDEVRGDIDNSAGILTAGAERLKAVADTPEEKRLAEAFAQHVQELVPAIQRDMVDLIAARAERSEYARLDDVVDNASQESYNFV